ncbi:MAG: hypothetical protein R2734_02140 [Nocardioides sp.]
MSAVASALEMERPAHERVESHLHPEGSFGVADHPVPTGREEVWRFTPLKRMRGLQADAPLDGSDFEVTAQVASGVTAGSVGVDHEARGSSGLVPTDRVSRAWAAAKRRLPRGRPRRGGGRRADRRDPARPLGRARRGRAPGDPRRRVLPGDGGGALQGRRRSPRTSRSSSGTALP